MPDETLRAVILAHEFVDAITPAWHRRAGVLPSTLELNRQALAEAVADLLQPHLDTIERLQRDLAEALVPVPTASPSAPKTTTTEGGSHA